MQTQGLDPVLSAEDGAAPVMDGPGDTNLQEHDRARSFDGERGVNA
ncbi:MAG: hypothetical protein JRG86_16380 [Deltaproteobacteria bacterium]|jgi:hypothetical protein|nr:hypothetical protein [Deltaproteobacteria bacterium]MBW2499735.1 hypothetical protein [Deltaproteobacteria bacterium]